MVYPPKSGSFVSFSTLNLVYTVLGPEKVLSKYLWNQRMNKCSKELINVKKKYGKDINLGIILTPNVIYKLKQSTIL